MTLDPVALLQQLIQIPSVNPMGRDVTGPHLGESRLTDFLQSQCEQLGLPWLRQEVHSGRDNLLALVRGNPTVEQGGELLLWDVHQDTVPADNMTVEPFGGEVRDGRVYGRGACDVKGAMAAMLAAVSQPNELSPGPSLQGRGSRGRPTIVLAFTINEECGFTGASALCELWRHDTKQRTTPIIVGGNISPAEIFPRPPDATIVAEPTQFQTVVAHQGVMRWRCHTIGRAAHTSRPDAGINAIYGMSKIVQAIEAYNGELQQNGPLHPLCGWPTTCVSTMHGGVGVNTVPEKATIEIDRRLGPSERPEAAYDDFVQYIAKHADMGQCRIVHDPPFMDGAPLNDDNNHDVGCQLANIVNRHGQASELVGVPYATDASAIAAAGIPTVVFGPGNIAQAHTADEFIDIDELKLATDIFQAIARDGLRP
jgi:acetylornithine deacetylase/succinyl-diaminopimelate desuccinylase-like protein